MQSEDSKGISSSSSDDSESDSGSSDSSSNDDVIDIETMCKEELGYGPNLYKNDDERVTFEQMPETEREKILFERYEKRKSLLETLKLRQQQKSQAKPATKRKSGRKIPGCEWA